MKDWNSARTLNDLGDLTALWLLGRVAAHPTQDAPPDEETASIRSPLVRLNRRGYVTDFSQPGAKLRGGFAQRAAVSGFCSEAVGRTLAALTLCSDLIALAWPAEALDVGYSIPVTIEEYHPFTWCGRFDRGDDVAVWEGLHTEAIQALRTSWHVVLIDPRWGRQRYLWRQVLRALENGIGRFKASPSPGLKLDADFVY